MADDPSTTTHTWAEWWADVSTIAEGLPLKRQFPPQSVIDSLFARFLELRRAEATADGTAPLLDHVVSSDPEFKDRYARTVATSAVATARSSILAYLRHEEPGLIAFPRPKASDSEMIAVRDGMIVVSGSVESGSHHIRALANLLAPGRPFVFARCPACGRIFARKGRRLRCSLSCTQKANDAKRPLEARREQNREAARRYREQQRIAKARNARRRPQKGDR